MRILKIIFTLLTITISSYCIAQSSSKIEEKVNAADNGDMSAAASLIHYYYNQKNYADAIKWSCNVLENANSKEETKGDACNYIGICTWYGYGGLTMSKEEAAKWWEKGSTEYNYSLCTSNLLDYYMSVDDASHTYATRILRLILKCADDGDMGAFYLLGKMYETGDYPLDEEYKVYIDGEVLKLGPSSNIINYQKALSYYEKFVGLLDGNCISHTNLYDKYKVEEDVVSLKLGNWYYEGQHGMQRDYDKAFEYFKYVSLKSDKISDADYGELFWKLSTCYRFGRGVTQSLLLGEKFAIKAAEKGNETAKKYIENNQ